MNRIVSVLVWMVCASSIALADGILESGAKPQKLQGEGAGEGPAWHPELGLLTSSGEHIFRRAIDGAVSIYRKDTGSNGLMFDRQGRLVMCQAAYRRVSRLDSPDKLTILADKFDGHRFNQPNDLTTDSKGRIYFSDPCYGDRSIIEMVDAEGRQVEGVYRIDSDGKVARIITHECDRPNGLVITPDDKYLYVADNNNDTVGGARKLWRFDLRGDGTIVPDSRKLIHDWKNSRGPDGMKLDAVGQLYVAAGRNKANLPYETTDRPAGIYVFALQGEQVEFIPIDNDETTNCAFGGDDLRTLFVTAGGTLWSVRVNTPGKPAWPVVK